MSSGNRRWLKKTKTAFEITLRRKDYERDLTADDIYKELPQSTKEMTVFEVAFVLHTIDDGVIRWVIQILRTCKEYIDSVWIMLSQPPHAPLLARAMNNALDIEPINSALIAQLFNILNECSVKYRLCLQAMGFSQFNLQSYRAINKSILQLLSISNRKKSIFFVPVLGRNWLTFYRQNTNEFCHLLRKIRECDMINSFGIWMRNEIIGEKEIQKYIIPLVQAMALNQNVSFLMFRFDVMLMDHSEVNDILFEAIASCLSRKKLAFTAKDSAISFSFRVDKYFHRDFLYGNDEKLSKLLHAIDGNQEICCNRMAISRGDIDISVSLFEAMASIIRNHEVHSLEQVIIDGYIDTEIGSNAFSQFVDALVNPVSQMKNISLHTIKADKFVSKEKIPQALIKLIECSNKMMNYIGICMDGFCDPFAYDIIDAYLHRIYRMYQSQIGMLNVLNGYLPFDIAYDIVSFCKMDCYVVSIQLKKDIMDKVDPNLELYKAYFMENFNKVFDEKIETGRRIVDPHFVYSAIAMHEVALYIGKKVNLHEFTQDDEWKVSLPVHAINID
eukprot:595696_1